MRIESGGVDGAVQLHGFLEVIDDVDEVVERGGVLWKVRHRFSIIGDCHVGKATQYYLTSVSGVVRQGLRGRALYSSFFVI